ncbi:MAG: zinc ribbon domain-containing protein [Deltaproteobacteria bacterium]|nr:zinc ribbon domain-containing protein [Deltaproteobacteria bacterium]
MPIFEYQCNKCKTDFTKLIFAGEEDKIKCPECSSKDIKKKMSMCSSISSCTSKTSKGFS